MLLPAAGLAVTKPEGNNRSRKYRKAIMNSLVLSDVLIGVYASLKHLIAVFTQMIIWDILWTWVPHNCNPLTANSYN